MSGRRRDQPADTKDAKRQVRCAIYTRKSSEEGLDQEFNSLDAQRESAEAFIASQRAEGWTCLPDRYDDGGFTGGNMERPALDRLLRDIEAGKVDCVVVYKVDRLSRSLMDFARIMSAFDGKGVSFVSVTQQFNTTSSMGRLTLNILLSFAQFEREIIGERIRDKIAAQKRRGKWAGGVPVLGYDVDRSGPSPHLVVNDPEAARVRQIFALYLERGSLLPVVTELARRQWPNKRRVTQTGRGKGQSLGGKAFDKCSLHQTLTNPIYLGKIVHKSAVYDGEHPPIIEADLFERVQTLLKTNGRTGGAEVRNKYGALLRGLLRCKCCDYAMTHTFAGVPFGWRYEWEEARLDDDAASMTFGQWVPLSQLDTSSGAEADGLKSGPGEPEMWAYNRHEGLLLRVFPQTDEGIDGFANMGACLVPGAPEQCPPPQAVVPMIRPVLEGATVELRAERTLSGETAWVFEAFNPVEWTRMTVPPLGGTP